MMFLIDDISITGLISVIFLMASPRISKSRSIALCKIMSDLKRMKLLSVLVFIASISIMIIQYRENILIIYAAYNSTFDCSISSINTLFRKDFLVTKSIFLPINASNFSKYEK